jgi:GAF domain-containing protein
MATAPGVRHHPGRMPPSPAPSPRQLFGRPRDALRWAAVLVVVLACVAAATGIGLLLPNSTGAIPPSLYMVAVVVSTVFAGPVAGLLTSLLGVLALDAFFIGSFGDLRVHTAENAVELAVFAATTALVAQILDRVRRAGEQAERQSRRRAALQSLTARLVTVLDPTRLAAAVVEADAGLDARSAFVATVDPEGDMLHMVSSAGYPPDMVRLWSSFSLSASVPASEAVRTGRPVFLGSRAERAARYPDLDRERVETGEGALVAIPLVVEGRPIGVLGLNFAHDHAFDAEDRDFLSTVGGQCAAALDRARLSREEEEARRRLEFLARASATLASSLDHETTLRQVAEMAVPEMADWASVELLNEDGGLDQVAVAHVDPAMVRWAQELRRHNPPDPDAQTGPAKVIRTGRSELYPEIPKEAIEALNEEQRDILERLALRSVVIVPLTGRDRPLGTIALVYSDSGRRYGEGDREFAEELGRRAGMAIENARLYRAEREAQARLGLLSNASRVLASSLDYETTLVQAARLAAEVLSEFAVLFLVQDGSVTAVTGAHRDPSRQELVDRALEAQRPPSEGEDDVVMRVFRTGQAAVIPEAAAAAPLDGLPGLPVRSGLVVPLVLNEQVLGALSLFNSEGARRYRQDDVHLAQEFARRMARAIENARLYRERDHVARTLQRSLLPASMPEVPGLDVATLYEPAGRGNEVGGDFYDVFPTAPGRWTVLIGDVCGKGAEAAAVMGMARHTIRALALHQRRPSGLLRSLNQAMIAQDPAGRFCTACCAELRRDGDSWRLTVASGGHPLPVLVQAGGARLIGAHGTVLGVFEEVELTDESLALGPGEAVVFYSDGLEERGSPVEERVMRILRGCGGLGAAGILQRLMQRTSAGGERRDDVALVAVRVRP